MNTYSTSQIARLIGVHPNTIRFYEDMKLLPAIPRRKNGYRVYDDSHIAQLKLLRIAFRAEIISDRLRQEVLEIVKTAATGNLEEAYQDTSNYLKHLTEEKKRAEEAIDICSAILNHVGMSEEICLYKGRKETAEILGITIDVLRDWERNGLIKVPRNKSGYREYGTREMNRLKIIRILRNAHYSMMSILRMLNLLDQGEVNIREAIDTPGEEEDIVCAADRYITALTMAEQDALTMLELIASRK